MDTKIWVLVVLVNIVRSRDIIVGSNDSGHKIYDENKHAGPAIWRQMENLTIAANDTEVISKIVITDLRAEKDGDAKIVEGGEGHNNVTIELKSPTVLRGYDFHIEAYAIPDGHQNTGKQSSGSTESNIPKKQSIEASTLQGNSESTVSLNKDLQSNIPETLTNDANVRQNRDTENKDKSVQEVNYNTASLPNTVNTNETTKIPLHETPTSAPYDMKPQVSDPKYPTVNREVEQKHTFVHPRVHIYEVTEMPKSTKRTIDSTNSKVPHTNIHGDQTSFKDDKNLQSNFEADKLHTHIGYPEFGARDSKQLPEPATNTTLPLVRQDGKNENLRHERDVSNPMEEKKGESKSFGVDDRANTDKTNIFNIQDQEHSHKPFEYPSTIDVKSSSPNQGNGVNHHVDHSPSTVTKDINKEQIQINGFSGQHSYRSFENTANVGDRNIMSSTEINKISTPLPKGDESTQSVGKFNIHSQPNVIGKSLPTTIIPDIAGTTEKSASNTEKLVNPSLQIKVEEANIDKPHDFKVIGEAKRNTRDTSINKKDKNDSTVPPVFRSFSTTLKPEIKSKDALSKNVANTDALGNPKRQEGNLSKDAKSDNTTVSIQNEQSNSHPSKIDISGTSNAVAPSSTSNKHVEYKPITEQQKTEIPNASTTPQARQISEVKERQTRDTSLVDQSKKEDKKISSTEKTVTAESETKFLQKVRNLNEEMSSDLESTITTSSAIANDKTINGDDAKKHDQINTTISANGNQQPTKISRETNLNEKEGSKKSSHKDQHSNIRLTTDLKVDAKDKLTSITPVIKENDEKDNKKATTEDTSKPKEKSE